eukprot:jgi/Hompol1/6899/HPOL_005118-RA
MRLFAANEIRFYTRNSGKYASFSNFSPHPIVIGDKLWPTVEHYFQAQKFAGTEYEELVRLSDSPRKAKTLGRSFPLREDWEQIKLDVMRDALAAKFEQNEDCKELLLESGDAKLIEDAPNDNFWGIGKGYGLNWLGMLLMELRTKMRNDARNRDASGSS